ncbi:MAG: GntR family transcriptional regulator [Candidatus Hydrogenedentota bacterium]
MLDNIDLHSPEPVYTQIEKQVQFAIAAGRLKSEDRLPSVRELSERLGVNPNTVAKAYRDLQLMGWVSARRNMGIFVTRGCEQRCRDDVRARIAQQIFQAVTEAKAAGMSRDEIVKAAEESFNSS